MFKNLTFEASQFFLHEISICVEYQRQNFFFFVEDIFILNLVPLVKQFFKYKKTSMVRKRNNHIFNCVLQDICACSGAYLVQIETREENEWIKENLLPALEEPGKLS